MNTKKITKNTLMEDVIKLKPQSIPIIEKYFGKGCFDCPGMQTETIEISSELHEIDLEKILQELNNS